MNPAPSATLETAEVGALAILNEIVHIQREYMREGDPQRMWDELLHSLMRTTSSSFGFIGEIEWSQAQIPTLNTRAMVGRRENGIEAPPHPDVALLVSQVIATQAPVVVELNAPRGSSGNDVLIDGFLGLPLVSSDRIVGLVGLVAPAEPFDNQWPDRLQPLLSACASIVESLQAATERSRLVAELERTAAFLQAVINGTTHSAVVIGPDGHIETANPAAHKLLEWGAGDLVGRPVADFFASETRRFNTLLMRRLLRTGVQTVGVPQLTNLVGRSGRSTPVEALIGDMLLDGERRLVVMFHDVTERIQAQAALARAAEVIEATPDLIAWADPDCRLVYMNAGGRTMLGWEPDQSVEDLTMSSFCEGGSGLLVGEAVRVAQETGVWRGETTMQRMDGGLVPVSVVITASEAYVAVLARDLTERREIDGLKEAFVSNVSHELRTPLTAVLGYLELLTEGVLGELTESQMDVLRIMSRNGDRLLDLIGDILLLGSLDAERSTPNRSIDFSALVSRVVADLDAVPEAGGVELKLESVAGLVVVGDEGELKTVVGNIIGNALKFTPSGGRVRVSVDVAGDQVVLGVCDSGIGIAPDEIDSVFNRFFRGRHARGSEVQGTGLGLAIVDGVVQQHGGSVDINSSVGIGTTVTVKLPLARKGTEE